VWVVRCSADPAAAAGFWSAFCAETIAGKSKKSAAPTKKSSRTRKTFSLGMRPVLSLLSPSF
jgi:hypothetical protein